VQRLDMTSSHEHDTGVGHLSCPRSELGIDESQLGTQLLERVGHR
jgi:hypothetical protein